MIIGIDASRAFLKRRTGIEEYAYQTIKHLRSVVKESDTVILYVRKKLVLKSIWFSVSVPEIDFELPKNWEVRPLWAPRFWTQIRLSIEMFLHSPDVLFVPAHTVPLIHPLRTIVTIHGLEYEFCKESYSFLDRLYMRLSIRFSCRVAETVICVSENTKKDVMRLYGVLEEKIKVIYEGFEENHSSIIAHQLSVGNPYLLFIGRLEERKNIVRIIEAFEILKEKYAIPHTLMLAGKPGHNYERIQFKIQNSKFKIFIKELGYISEEEKWELLKNADVFLFPSLYEGFGIPVLEAQSVGVPVVTSNISSLPEVGGEGAVYVDPNDAESIADGIQSVLSDKARRDDIIVKATQNVSCFSWTRCAEEISLIFDK
ncbi:MAG: glycosyltransferase family 1 protein [Candidatus Moraniibacteriota bacterium]